jgi:hypothetical protein
MSGETLSAVYATRRPGAECDGWRQTFRWMRIYL